MEIERAVEILKVRNEFVTDINIDAKISYKMAIESLEKQIPSKVEEGTEGGLDWYCKCGTYLAPTKCKEIKYCINCGQKLDWD